MPEAQIHRYKSEQQSHNDPHLLCASIIRRIILHGVTLGIIPLASAPALDEREGGSAEAPSFLTCNGDSRISAER